MKVTAHTLISQFDGMATLLGIYASQEKAEEKLISMVRNKVENHPEIARNLEWSCKQDGSIECVYTDGIYCGGLVLDLSIEKTAFELEV